MELVFKELNMRKTQLFQLKLYQDKELKDHKETLQ